MARFRITYAANVHPAEQRHKEIVADDEYDPGGQWFVFVRTVGGEQDLIEIHKNAVHRVEKIED